MLRKSESLYNTKLKSSPIKTCLVLGQESFFLLFRNRNWVYLNLGHIYFQVKGSIMLSGIRKSPLSSLCILCSLYLKLLYKRNANPLEFIL